MITSMLTPATETEAADIIRAHAESRTPLHIRGGGSRAGFGNPGAIETVLSSTALTGIVEYNPAEMVITARAGTPVAEIEAALAEGLANGITAKGVTPFLLQRIFELTEGRSLASNIALVLNNARLAATIAREISTQLRQWPIAASTSNTPQARRSGGVWTGVMTAQTRLSGSRNR